MNYYRIGAILSTFAVVPFLFYFNANPTDAALENNMKDEKLIFGAILTAAAAILAISFTISQNIIGKIAKDYSPYLVKYYYKIDTMAGFTGFLISIILSAIGLSIVTPLTPLEHQQFILVTLTFFIGSLVSYAWNFQQITNIINPLKFSKYIFTFTKDVLKKENNEIENLIISMGNTTLKFINDNESRITIEFLEEFKKLAEQYLLQKAKHDEIGIEKEFYNNLNKSPISPIVIQLQRIYKHAYENNDFEVSRKIITIIDEILRKAMEFENNDDIIRLFTSRGYGYVLSSLLEITLSDRKERLEKEFLASSLFMLPLNFLRSEKVIFRYLDYLAPEHIFYTMKKIIDENDFEFFTHLVKESTVNFLDFEPGEIADEIFYELLNDRSSATLSKHTYELEFEILIECALNHRNLMKFLDKLESYKNLLLGIEATAPEEIEDRIEGLKVKSLRYYVNSLIYQAFFWVGAYLVYKGKDYERYLHKLWNISNPPEDPTTYLNKPPVPTKLTWSILQVLGNDRFTTTPEFGDYQSAEPFLYKYCDMIILKSNELFNFVSPMDVKSLVENGENEILSKWMGICHRLQSDAFIKNMENLNEKVDLNKFFSYSDAMDVLRNRIVHMQDSAKECEKTIERLRPMDVKLINETVKSAFERYKKYSKIDSITTVKLTEVTSQEFDIISPKFALPRHAFQETTGVAIYLDSYFESISLELSRNEIGAIVNKIDKTHKIFKEKTTLENLHINLQKLYDKMKLANHEPDLIFIPFILQAEFQKQTRSPYSSQISLGGRVLDTIHTIKNDEIILVCKKSIEITYLKTNQGRISITITEDIVNTQNAVITYFMAIKTDILDVEGINKMTISGVERSRFYKKPK